MKHHFKKCLISLFCLSLSLPVWAQETTEAPPTLETTEVKETPTEDTVEPATEDKTAPSEEGDEVAAEEDEDPALPDNMLLLPEEDPDFEGRDAEMDLPLEDDFANMLPSENPLFWRVELRNGTGYTSNVDFLADAQGSLKNELSLSGILRYSFPSDTQILLRSQGFLNNFFNVQDRDHLIGIPLSLTVSQWLFDKVNLYGGYVPLLSSSIGRSDNETIQRFDNDFNFGATYYEIIDKKHILYGGYQFDFLKADLDELSYIGNRFFVSYRHLLQKNLYAFVDAYAQPRGYLTGSALVDEIQAGGSGSLQWQILPPWFIIEAKTSYTQIYNFNNADRNAGIFYAGINLIGALQSK